MKEIVFKQPPKLNSKEKRIAELHSILNILNVLAGELSLLEVGLMSEQAGILKKLVGEIVSIARDMQEIDDVSAAFTRVRASEGPVIAAVRDLLKEVTDAAILADIRDSLSNVESVYRIVHKRLDEIEARVNNPDVLISVPAEEFNRQFRELFYAIEKNAKGRYRIFFNLARKTKCDYYIDLKIESALKDGALLIPLRLVDVIRDLTANARKYTDPGGKVALAIYQNQQDIKVLIQDSGCGIPEDEVERVVEFGYRATNVRDRPTMGGGFGLTKAAWLTNHWGGKLSIESAEGKGTTVRLTVPNQVIAEAL